MPSGGVGSHEQVRLRLRIGNGEPRFSTVRVDRGVRDNGQDGVSVGHRQVVILKKKQAATLGAHISVAGGIENLTPAAPGQHRCLGKRDETGGMQVQTDAAGERLGAFPRTDGPARLVEGDECRGAGGVDRHAGTVQVVDIRQTVGSDAGRVAGRERGVDRSEVVGKTIGIICAGNADEDPAGTATQFRRSDSGVFQGLPGHLEQQALLGIHEGGFSGRNAKEPGIEPGNVTETAGSDRIRGSGMIPVRMQKCIQGPALGINLGHQVPASKQVFPEAGDAGSWEPERCPNNCDFSDHGAILCDFDGNETAAYQAIVGSPFETRTRPFANAVSFSTRAMLHVSGIGTLSGRSRSVCWMRRECAPSA